MQGKSIRAPRGARLVLLPCTPAAADNISLAPP